jgi:hypothetical protein
MLKNIKIIIKVLDKKDKSKTTKQPIKLRQTKNISKSKKSE